MVWWAEANRAGWLVTDGRSKFRPNRSGYIIFVFGKRETPFSWGYLISRRARKALRWPAGHMRSADNRSSELMRLCIEIARQMNIAEAHGEGARRRPAHS